MKSTFLIAFQIVSIFATAQVLAACRWEKMLGEKIMRFDSDLSLNKELTANEVKEDLECLKIVLRDHYVAIDFYKDIPILTRLDEKIQNSYPSSSIDLIDNIFEIHDGAIDIHIAYSLWHSDYFKSFYKPNKANVKASEEFAKEKVLDLKGFIYFKPGDLRDTISKPQMDFVEFVRDNDKNLVIDMRGNPGGDDPFIDLLTETLFSQTQTVPKSYRYEVDSLFKRAGLCISLKVMGYSSANQYCDNIKSEIQGKTLEDVMSFSIVESGEEFFGRRKTDYQSKIKLLIDSGCASACETLVERLSWHPQVQVIGQNTAGALHFSNAIQIMLPNSGIIASIPTLLHTYENDAPEGVGYAPDIYLDYIDFDFLF